ncbi:unnamed protein product [Tilletia caries]|nr:unnamed protein product [Tilletia caries]CAD7065327.1 unnamed protein product [Tilletia caries]
MLTGLLPHPWAASLAVARTARTPVLQHPPHIRTREDADFTPEQVQNKRSTAESTTAETESGGVATGTSTSQDPARPIKPVRQAALQASARLTKEAQAKALGLGASGRTSGLLGASLGIAGRKTSADASPSVDTSSADREADAMDQDTDETANGADVGILPKDQDLAMIEATQQRQQKKAADMAELCRVIDKACISGAVMETGAELLRAALAIALRHGELGPSGPPVAAALIDNVRSYPVDKPHKYQRKTASAEKRPETSTLTARQTSGGAAVPPRQMAPVMFVPLEAAGLALSTTIIKAGIEESIGAKLVRAPHRLRHGTGAEDELWNHVQFAVLEEDKVRRPRAVAIAGVEYQAATIRHVANTAARRPTRRKTTRASTALGMALGPARPSARTATARTARTTSPASSRRG